MLKHKQCSFCPKFSKKRSIVYALASFFKHIHFMWNLQSLGIFAYFLLGAWSMPAIFRYFFRRNVIFLWIQIQRLVLTEIARLVDNFFIGLHAIFVRSSLLFFWTSASFWCIKHYFLANPKFNQKMIKHQFKFELKAVTVKNTSNRPQ